MNYFIWGRKSENAPIQRLSGPWRTLIIAKGKKLAAQLDGYFDVKIRKVAPKLLRGGSGRRGTGR
jgi:hypothetical protein